MPNIFGIWGALKLLVGNRFKVIADSVVYGIVLASGVLYLIGRDNIVDTLFVFGCRKAISSSQIEAESVLVELDNRTTWNNEDIVYLDAAGSLKSIRKQFAWQKSGGLFHRADIAEIMGVRVLIPLGSHRDVRVRLVSASINNFEIQLVAEAIGFNKKYPIKSAQVGKFTIFWQQKSF